MAAADLLRIRSGSTLFRLYSAQDVKERLTAGRWSRPATTLRPGLSGSHPGPPWCSRWS